MLVTKHLVETDLPDGRIRARLGHPLVGEVLQQGAAEPKRQRLLHAVADAIDAEGDGRDHGELLRVVTWQLDAGIAVEPDAPRGCGSDVHPHRHQLAERLAREAYERGVGFDAIDVLAQVNQFTQRPADTEVAARAVDIDALSPADCVRP